MLVPIKSDSMLSFIPACILDPTLMDKKKKNVPCVYVYVFLLKGDLSSHTDPPVSFTSVYCVCVVERKICY